MPCMYKASYTSAYNSFWFSAGLRFTTAQPSFSSLHDTARSKQNDFRLKYIWISISTFRQPVVPSWGATEATDRMARKRYLSTMCTTTLKSEVY